MSISRRLDTQGFSAELNRLIVWLAGDHSALPVFSANGVVDDGTVAYEGEAIRYRLESMGEHYVVDAFFTGSRAALETVTPRGPDGHDQRHVWLVRFDGESIVKLLLNSTTNVGIESDRERYSTPPPSHPDYLKTLGFHPSNDANDGLPKGERLTDGRIVVSLCNAIGVYGWAKVGAEVYTLGSHSTLGAQLWALQRDVPFGSTRDERLADFEITAVHDEIRASAFISKLEGTWLPAAEGMTLKRVDVAWHIDELWRASVNRWLEWKCAPTR